MVKNLFILKYLLFIFLGGKHKVIPPNLEDSLGPNLEDTENSPTTPPDQMQNLTSENNQTVESEKVNNKENTTPLEEIQNTPSTSSASSSAYSDRFKKTKRKIVPSKQDEFLKALKEEKKQRTEEFSFLRAHLQKSEEQKERFLTILEKAFSIDK